MQNSLNIQLNLVDTPKFFPAKADKKAFVTFRGAWNGASENDKLYLSCVAFDKNAENISSRFDKGGQIALTGSLRTEEYKDKDTDEVRYNQQLVVQSWSFSGRSGKNSEEPAPAPAPSDAKGAGKKTSGSRR